jgi:MoaA/NifB/PqqE/SkfB family radical SAM enzyme
VYLSGWGEPLLNPRFFDMLRMAKEADCSAGFTTNGALLDTAFAETIINLRTDVVSVSFAGASAKKHESIRVGSDFKQLVHNVCTLGRMKRGTRSEKPQILILFMMTRENMDELPTIINLATHVKADGLVATNLDYTPLPFHYELKAFSASRDRETYDRYVQEAREMAENVGIYFHVFPIEAKVTPVCTENPLKNLYISEDGSVFPCVYAGLPLDKIPRVFCGERGIVPRISFGNINNEDLFGIWNKPDYVSFRRRFEQRVKSEARTSDDLPDICRTCHKAFGV